MLLKQKNFFNLFAGRLVSNCGDSIYAVLLSWYILSVTKSSKYVGILQAIIFLPNIFAFAFGPWIDKNKKKKLLIFLEATQGLAIVGIIIGMQIYNQFNLLGLIIIYAFALIAATSSNNTYTVQDALVPQIVSTENLPQAEMYMSVAYNGTDYVFTALTGFLLKAISYIPLLLIDICTFIFSIFSFSKINYQENIEPEKENSSILLGFKIILKSKPLLILTIGSAILNFIFGGLNVYELLIAKSIGGSSFYGLLSACGSVGTLLGSTIIANWILKFMPIGKVLCLSGLLFGVTIIPAIFFEKQGMSLLLIWLISFLFLGISQVVQKPILQTEIPKQLMGKTISAFYTLTVSSLSVGSVVFGYIADNISWKLFIFFFGICIIICNIIYILTKQLWNYSLN